MNAKPGNPIESRPTKRFPRGPLILIVLVLASVAWAYWLTRSTPRPPPEIPPLRQLPLDSLQQQESRQEPATGARERQ
jgi:hypothetical protein